MINTIHGDVLDTTNAVIVHCVNCLGIMGAGIAKQIRIRFPEAYDVYRESYDSKLLTLGSVTYMYYPKTEQSEQKIIANAAGQETVGTKTRQVDYDATRMCFYNINDAMKIFENEFKISTINFPLFGCGLAGGDWQIISKIIEEEVNDKWTKNLFLYP